MIEATAFDDEDKNRLSALIQQSEAAADGDDDMSLTQETGAPDPAAYESKSGGILDTRADMQEKAEATLDDKQKAEMESKQNYEMLKLSLTDAITAAKKELADTKKDKAAAGTAFTQALLLRCRADTADRTAPLPHHQRRRQARRAPRPICRACRATLIALPLRRARVAPPRHPCFPPPARPPPPPPLPLLPGPSRLAARAATSCRSLARCA